MISKQRLHLMTTIADFKQENQDKSLRIMRYYRSDYIAHALVKNLILTTIAFFVLLGIFAVYRMDFILNNLNNLKFGPLAASLLIIFLMMQGVFGVISYVIARIQYLEAEDEAREYDQKLRLLRRMYVEEQREITDPFGGSDR